MAVTAKFINGLKEIGGTFVEIETGAAKCVFDFGYAKGGLLDRDIPLRPEFAASDLASFGVLPRTDGVYDESNAKILNVLSYEAFKAQKECFVLVSHLHIDHMGGLGRLHPEIPVYMTEDSLTLYRRLVENDDVQGAAHENCIGVKPGETFRVGDIEVLPLETDHDVKGACGFLIKTQGKTICYTGDYRFHGFHRELTEAFVQAAAKETVDLLITESTMVSHGDVDMLSLRAPEAGKRTEENLQQELGEWAKASTGLLLVDFYPRNVERVHRLIETMSRHGRKLVLNDMTCDYVHAFYPEDPLYVYAETMAEAQRPAAWNRVTRADILAQPGQYVLQLDHESLYEALSFRAVATAFLHFDGPPFGDYDPAYRKMLALLEACGIPFERLGVSGHAEPYYLRYLIDTIQPRILVPLHSFRPEQVQSNKVGKRILPEEGEIIRLL